VGTARYSLEQIADAHRATEQATATGRIVIDPQDHFGLGFEAQGVRYPFLGTDAFGHSGAAGSQAFADPHSGIAYGYTRRRFAFPPGGGAPENHRLAAAVLRAAIAQPTER
jgi:hypothetical protein